MRILSHQYLISLSSWSMLIIWYFTHVSISIAFLSRTKNFQRSSGKFYVEYGELIYIEKFWEAIDSLLFTSNQWLPLPTKNNSVLMLLLQLPWLKFLLLLQSQVILILYWSSFLSSSQDTSSSLAFRIEWF